MREERQIDSLQTVMVPDSNSKLMEINDLRVSFFMDEGIVEALKGIDLTLYRNRTLGVVGESGCGKSVLGQALLRIIPEPGRITSGTIVYHGLDEPIDLAALNPRGKQIRRIRGREIAMIFQEPSTALIPVYSIGDQITEAIRLHQQVDKVTAREMAIDLLHRVDIPNPEERIDQYPFELSGGLRQRAVIAMALSCHPKLLIADEPTTALDVTIQKAILDLFQELKEQFQLSLILISHDLAVVSEVAHDVAVMYNGCLVEYAPVLEIFRNPLHPYTRALLDSIPIIGRSDGKRLMPIQGNLPEPFARIEGCQFFDRCPQAVPGRCDPDRPALLPAAEGHKVACVLLTEKAQEEMASG